MESAPYPGHSDDREAIVGGLDWVDLPSRGKRHGAGVLPRPRSRSGRRCCARTSRSTAPERRRSSSRRFRDLVAVGYYTTPDGMKEIGYVGNSSRSRPKFEGPPR